LSSSPPRSIGRPAPGDITYKYACTIEEKLVSLGPRMNFEGVVVERYKKLPIAKSDRDQGPRDGGAHDEHGAFAFTDCRSVRIKSRCRGGARHG